MACKAFKSLRAVVISVAIAYILASPGNALNVISNLVYIGCFGMLVVSGLLLPEPEPEKRVLLEVALDGSRIPKKSTHIMQNTLYNIRYICIYTHIL